MAAMTTTALAPPELAARWRVSPEKIIAMIRREALHGFDVSLPGSKRPRYRINLSEVVAYEERRTARQPMKTARRKRKKQDDGFVRYFS